MSKERLPERQLAVVILAAGKGTRMNDPSMAKVMHQIDGTPMVGYVLRLAGEIGANRTLVIVGWQKESVTVYVRENFSNCEIVEQTEQLGTGHAMMQTAPVLKEFQGDILVLSGDVPLLTSRTVSAMIGYHRTSAAVSTILTAVVEDPFGYGRIIRNEDGSVRRIVEQKDATEEEQRVREINSGIYVFDAATLFGSLPMLQPNNVQKEYYLTDIFEIFWRNRSRVSAVKSIEPGEILGINTVAQLEEARIEIGRRASPDG